MRTGSGLSKALRDISTLCLSLVILIMITGCASETPIFEQEISAPTPSIPSIPSIETTSNPDQTGREACPESSPHPVAADIAETFDVEYLLVIGWFCDGYAFDEILLALQTQKIVDVEVDFLLEERDSGKSWDQIWRELEITSG